jgi:N-acetylmuramoyl-L-alanine amidase
MRTLFFFLAAVLVTTAAAAQTPNDRYAKLRGVLAHLGLGDEPSYYNDLKLWDGAQTRKGFDTILKYMDPSNHLARYLSVGDDRVQLYLDRDSKESIDFSLALKSTGVPEDRRGWIEAIRRAANNPPNLPLLGLRVALDPGHMGGPFWDDQTGKYVSIAGVGHVSEGVIAFDTCLLLMRELRALGADVRITRRGLEPVTELPLETFDLAPFISAETRASTDLPWFDRLLHSAPLGSRLFELVDRSHELAAIRSEAKRSYYFISRADLQARARLINSFHPHLVLVVHFDADNLHKLQNEGTEVRAYIPGNLLEGETSTREARALALRNLLDGHRWMESAVFSAAVVKGISDATGVKIKRDPVDTQAIKVNDGVYARNLALNRLVSEGIMTYVEVLRYDYEPDFHRLVTHSRHTEVDGIRIDYPARLDKIVEGMKQGVLDYVLSMAKSPLARL